MFERFTDRARAAVVAAQEEARSLGHAYIGSEHVLLGLLNDSDAIAGKALATLGVTLARTRAESERLVGRGDGSPMGHIPFTPRAKKILELSLREALGLGHNYIGTEHIVLGLVREGEGVAIQLLTLQGASPQQVRAAVLAELAAVTATRLGGPADKPKVPRRTPGAEALIAAAQELAGDAPMGSHHLLEAMALSDGSLAGNALAALGIDPDALAAKIDELGIEGTTDITPEIAAARQMEIRLDDHAVTLVLGDDIVHALTTTITAALGNPTRGADDASGILVGLWQAVQEAMQVLSDRLAPPEPDDAAEPAGRAAIVRAAVRNRLRRRGA